MLGHRFKARDARGEMIATAHRADDGRWVIHNLDKNTFCTRNCDAGVIAKLVSIGAVCRVVEALGAIEKTIWHGDLGHLPRI